VLVFLLVFLLATILLLAAWSLFFQAYIYEQPAQGLLTWRAPAAGAAVTAFVAAWALLAQKADHKLGLLFDFSASEGKEFKELWTTDKEGHKLGHYKLVGGEKPRFLLNGNTAAKKELPTRPDGILVVEDGAEVLFKPDRDAEGHFKSREGEWLEYRDARGRVMIENQWGKVGRFRFGWFLANVGLNLLFLAAWVAVLWLLLEFQFWHALGQAVVVWLALELFVLGHVIS
jgi:hypothetical protein